jgi:hypothetical protein
MIIGKKQIAEFAHCEFENYGIIRRPSVPLDYDSSSSARVNESKKKNLTSFSFNFLHQNLFDGRNFNPSF